MWSRWRPLLKWKTLCPVLFADSLGLVVVMPRAIQPVDFSEIDALPDYYPDITAESKVEDYGRLDGVVVAVDYGLPDKEMVTHQRVYYSKMSSNPAQVISDN